MVKFYGQFSNPKVDEYLLNRYFLNKRDGVFIECGAYDGTLDSSCRVFEESFGWKGINIEPDPEIFCKLKSNRPKSINLQNLLVETNLDGKELDFIGIKLPGVGHTGLGYTQSPSNTNADNLNVYQKKSAIKSTTKVLGISYKSLISTYGLKEVDLFVLDVEGYELNILKDLTPDMVLPKVFCIEYNLVGLNNITDILNKLGYRFDTTMHVNAHFIK